MKNKKIWASLCSALLLVACLLSGTLSKWAFTYRGSRIAGAAAKKDAEVKEISTFFSIVADGNVNSATIVTSYSKKEIEQNQETQITAEEQCFFADDQALMVIQGTVNAKTDSAVTATLDVNISVFSHQTEEGKEETFYKIDKFLWKNGESEYSVTTKGKWVNIADALKARLVVVWEGVSLLVSYMEEDQSKFEELFAFSVLSYPYSNYYENNKAKWEQYMTAHPTESQIPDVWKDTAEWEMEVTTRYPTKPKFSYLLNTISEEDGQGYRVEQSTEYKNINNTTIVFPLNDVKQVSSEEEFTALISVQEK